MWFTETWGEPEPELARDRKVTLTVGQLTDALAEALKVVSDAGPQWKKGDHAYVEVEVQGTRDSDVFFTFANFHSKSHFTLPASLLQEIEE
jgi:hypothetical protein